MAHSLIVDRTYLLSRLVAELHGGVCRFIRAYIYPYSMEFLLVEPPQLIDILPPPYIVLNFLKWLQ